MDNKFDCVVIGAGIIGVSAAVCLQREGLSVALVDPNLPGSGASYGNAGCINGSSVVPLSMPGMLRSVPGWMLDPMGPLAIRRSYIVTIMPWLWQFLQAGRMDLVREQAKALRTLLAPSIPYLKQLIGPANLDHLIKTEGHLYVYRSPATFASDQLAWSIRRENGVVFEEIVSSQLREFDPNLSSAYCRGVWIAENGHTINPGRLVTGLADHFTASGGTVIRARVTGFVLSGGTLTALETEHGRIKTARAVVSSGAHSQSLTHLLGDRIPLETERGYHAVILDPEILPRVPTTDADRKFVATPMEAGLRLAGTVEFGGLDAAPNWDRARKLLAHAKFMFPKLSIQHGDDRIEFWMGHRPSLPDSLPVIDRSSACPNVIYAFGHGHVGMTAAPLTSRLVADLVQRRRPTIDIAPFKASRFAM